MKESTEQVIKRHQTQFVTRFGENVHIKTFFAILTLTGIASEISSKESDKAANEFMEMVARFVLDIREAHP